MLQCTDPHTSDAAWNRDEFEAKLRESGAAYHIHHPFNRMLNEGKATREQIRGWVANRYYYQISIPVKDAAILSNCPSRAMRREWIQRILDHDGLWRRRRRHRGVDAARASRSAFRAKKLEDLRHVLPGVRFAVDAYVNFARRAPWQEAMCSSLTELFAPKIHKERLANWPEHYPWIETTGLQYFRNRLTQARRDVEQALSVTLDYFTTRAEQERALGILKFKLDVLWAMNDAMALGYASQS